MDSRSITFSKLSHLVQVAVTSTVSF